MRPKPGDLILYPVNGRSGWASKFVAVFEIILGAGHDFEQYSHVAIVGEQEGTQWEWKWPRSGCFPVDASRAYEVWRVGDPSPSQRRRILEYCSQHSGEVYNLIGLLTFGLLGLPRTAVCSQGAGRAYKNAHIMIGKEGKPLLSPNAIPDYKGAEMVVRVKPKGKEG